MSRSACGGSHDEAEKSTDSAGNAGVWRDDRGMCIFATFSSSFSERSSDGLKPARAPRGKRRKRNGVVDFHGSQALQTSQVNRTVQMSEVSNDRLVFPLLHVDQNNGDEATR